MRRKIKNVRKRKMCEKAKVRDDACDAGSGVAAQVGEQAQASAHGSIPVHLKHRALNAIAFALGQSLLHVFVDFVYFVFPTALPQSLGRIVAR
jgi:hypothetical protein